MSDPHQNLRTVADTVVIAIFYNITNSSLDNYRGKHDYWNSLGAGAVAGAIYKATGELRPLLSIVIWAPTDHSSRSTSRHGWCWIGDSVCCELVILQDYRVIT